MKKIKISRYEFIILAVVFTMTVVLSSCAPKSKQDIKRFKDIIDIYDDTYDVRLKECEDEEIIRCYKSEDNRIFLYRASGYEDTIFIYAVLDDKNIKDVRILWHRESEDYGEYVSEDWFLKRLLMSYEKGLQLVKIRKEKDNEVIAITGATETSQAVVDAINKCIKLAEEVKYEEEP